MLKELICDHTGTRYRPKNLLIPVIMLGEPTAEDLQNYSKIIVDDLIKLYKDGVRVVTRTMPNGKFLRYIMILFADHCNPRPFGSRIPPCDYMRPSRDVQGLRVC